MKKMKYGVVLLAALLMFSFASCEITGKKFKITFETITQETITQETITQETTLDENKVYVKEIKCNGITVLNENPKSYGVDRINADGLPEYRFAFIDGKYTKDPESLASNPNVVRIDYEVLPHTVDGPQVRCMFEEKDYVHFDEATQTFVFLRNNRSLTVTIESTDGSNVKTTIVIKSRS